MLLLLNSSLEFNTFTVRQMPFVLQISNSVSQFSLQPQEHLQSPPCCQTPSHGVRAESPAKPQHADDVNEALLSKISFELMCSICHLLSCSDDKHAPQDEALAVHVTLVTGLPGPHEVLPNTETNEPHTAHLPLQRPVEVFLQ